MNAQERFAEKLFEVAVKDINKLDVEKISAELMQAFLDFGSETEENVNCFESIEYGVAPKDDEGKQVLSLKLKEYNLSLANIIHAMEGCTVPPEVLEDFPDMTQAEWDAVLRMTTMIYLALEKPVKDSVKLKQF